MAKFTGCVTGSWILPAILQDINNEYLCLEPRQWSCRTNRGVYGRVYRVCTWILPAILQKADPPYARAWTIISHKGKAYFSF